MIKDYLILDNILPDPERVRDALLSLSYYSMENFELKGVNNLLNSENKPDGNWRGFRTSNLMMEYGEAPYTLLNTVLHKSFNVPLKFNGTMYGHIATSEMTDLIPKKNRWHKDQGFIFAGVIYLAKNPTKNSGTWLNLKSKKIHVSNKFNRLVMYKADIPHSPGNFFGSTAEDSRLTLSFFIDELRLFNTRYLPVAQ